MKVIKVTASISVELCVTGDAGLASTQQPGPDRDGDPCLLLGLVKSQSAGALCRGVSSLGEIAQRDCLIFFVCLFVFCL